MLVHLFYLIVVIITFSLNTAVYCNHVQPRNISIISFKINSPNSSEHVKEVKKNQYHVLTTVDVGLECLSTSPIKIIFSGLMPNKIEYTRMEWNRKTKLYRVTIGFKSTPQATGPYTCVTINETVAFNSTIYIFADDGKSGLLLLHWKRNMMGEIEISDFETENKIIIPCLTFRPSVIPNLYYYSTSSNPPVVPKNTYQYDPSEGFRVDIAQSPYYNFKCELTGSSSSSLKFKIPVIKIKVIPTGVIEKNNVIYWIPSKNRISIECNSISPIEIIIEMKGPKPKDTLKMQQNSKSAKQNSFYKYVENLSIESSNVRNKELYNGSIICRNKQGSDERIIVIGSPPSAPQSNKKTIGFNEVTNEFYCSKNSDETPTMTLTDCSNLANCDVVRRFEPFITIHKFNNKYPYSYNRSTLADRYLKAELKVEQDNDCAVIKPVLDVKLGMVHCRFIGKTPNVPTDNSIVSLQYFVDLNNSIVMEGEYKKTAVVLKMHSEKTDVYFMETVTFTCEASIFVFSKGLEFSIKYKNVSGVNKMTDLYPRNAVEVDNGYNKIILNETIKIWSKDIESIECRALKWAHQQWENTSVNIKVKDSQEPIIFSDGYVNKTNNSIVYLEFHDHDSHKNVTCTATGLPLPTIEWIRTETLKAKNKFPFNNNANTTEVLGNVTSTLVFDSVLSLHEGYYVCKAKSSVGETNLTFMITVIKNDTGHSINGGNDTLLGQHLWILYIIVPISLILLLLLVAIALLCRTLQSKQSEIEKLSKVEIHHFINGNEDIAKKYQELHEVAQYLPYKQEYEIHPSKIDIKNEILGTGNYGMVLKGTLEKSGKKFPVAVKTVKSGTDISHLRSLLSEIKIMMYIGKHPCIIEMIGAITKNLQDGKLFVAVEFCSNGNLQSYLRICRPVFQNQIVDDEIKIVREIRITKSPRRFLGIEDAITNAIEKRRSRNSQLPPSLTTVNLINWCYQVASGMAYLADKKVIHGDLATRNLLITDSLAVKITDFGLARHLYEYSNYVTKQKTDPVPWRWLSIEAIQDSKFSTDSDVWAYGVTLWEIFSLGEIPYQGFSWGEEFVQDLCKGYRMGKPQYATDDIYNTMLECWNTVGKDRPSFRDISSNFKELLERVNVYVEDMDTSKIEDPKHATIPEIFICSEV